MTGQQLVDTVPLSSAGHAYLRFRDPVWRDPEDYLRLSVLALRDGRRSLGPWAHLFARRTQEAIGEPTPQVILLLTVDGIFDLAAFLEQEIVLFTGPLDPSDAHTIDPVDT